MTGSNILQTLSSTVHKSISCFFYLLSHPSPSIGFPPLSPQIHQHSALSHPLCISLIPLLKVLILPHIPIHILQLRSSLQWVKQQCITCEDRTGESVQEQPNFCPLCFIIHTPSFNHSLQSLAADHAGNMYPPNHLQSRPLLHSSTTIGSSANMISIAVQGWESRVLLRNLCYNRWGQAVKGYSNSGDKYSS